ncbi:hypothetical protein RchiOBHm_Chr6g0289501 [Rosa chinensis]|uniref:Uncharacterized protein n=1 Tax=Rosa chinensis TaxID=74649 RepID=A0A2P6PVL8_ROSCH|nr:hypothetical protein RchiOBHm_Chr6g0289501 [Rosa chinensis]
MYVPLMKVVEFGHVESRAKLWSECYFCSGLKNIVQGRLLCCARRATAQHRAPD